MTHEDAARKDPVKFMTDNGFDFDGLPESLRPGYARWWCFGIPAGSFLQAVIDNDFIKAITKADAKNLNMIRSIAIWMHNNGDDRATRANASSWAKGGGHFGRIKSGAANET